ncbi:hypothetical protein LCL95_03265 [Bacillus timonensis]|nr:hypothetical protein [Bacillus timonensis]
MNINLFQSSLKGFVDGSNQTSLKKNQHFYGRVIKNVTNNHSFIQLGSSTILAQTDLKLTKGNVYLFRVDSVEEHLRVKVVEPYNSNKTSDVKSGIDTKMESEIKSMYPQRNHHIIERLLRSQLPLSNKLLSESIKLLNYVDDIDRGITALHFLNENRLPIGKTTFDALYAMLDEKNLYSELENFNSILKNTQNKNDTVRELIDKNDQLLKVISRVHDNNFEASKVVEYFKRVISIIGLNHEGLLLNGEIEGMTHSIKRLLLQLNIENEYPQLKRTIEHLINRITGQQLLNVDMIDSHHFWMDIPFKSEDKYKDWFIQYYGQKKRNGKIDPNFCHILCYVHLSKLADTIIDVKIQNRIINITITNEVSDLSEQIKSLKPLLEANLKKINYKLSSVKHNQSLNIEKIKNLPKAQKRTSGVDLLI